MRNARVEIVTKGLGILPAEITGIRDSIQVAQVHVLEIGKEESRHLLVMAYYPKIELNLCEEISINLQKHFGKVIVSFLLEDKIGRAIVFVPLKQDKGFSLFSVACAVAVVKRSWGWDESEFILVESFSTYETFTLSPQCEDGQWVVTH